MRSLLGGASVTRPPHGALQPPREEITTPTELQLPNGKHEPFDPEDIFIIINTQRRIASMKLQWKASVCEFSLAELEKSSRLQDVIFLTFPERKKKLKKKSHIRTLETRPMMWVLSVSVEWEMDEIYCPSRWTASPQ